MANMYKRIPVAVEAIPYEPGKGLEDGFYPYKDLVTSGLIATDGLLILTREDGVAICPYVQSDRGISFIREHDYIIKEQGGGRHCCSAERFPTRYKPMANYGLTEE